MSFPPALASITVDLHEGDSVDDVRIALDMLDARGIQATLFVPSALLRKRPFRTVIADAASRGHETASHSHNHDVTEMHALMRGSAYHLSFLSMSWGIHCDALGAAPRAFRSPAWCHLGAAAVQALSRLGYRVDSSATPQRLGVFSSTPFANVWTFASRRLTYLAPGLLEVPTSTLGVPAGSPAFSILRSRPSHALVALLATEARLLRGRVLCLQFHPHAFNPKSSHRYERPPSLTAGCFLPNRQGGFALKHFIRSSDNASAAALTSALLDSVSSFRCLTLSGIADLVA